MIYRFAEFELDSARGELRRAGGVVPLQPKPLALLTILVSERERVVPNEELLERLWPDEHVTPSSLARAVSVARSAIEDTGQGRRIQSFPRRGYRFVEAVIEVPEAAEAELLQSDGVPFVGRNEALSRLQELWQRAALGRGQAALVCGPAGIGKTQLAG